MMHAQARNAYPVVNLSASGRNTTSMDPIGRLCVPLGSVCATREAVPALPACCSMAHISMASVLFILQIPTPGAPLRYTSMLPLLSSVMYILVRSLSGVDARAVNTTITSLPTSAISSSILANPVDGSASPQRCGDIDHCRTLNGIIQSCLVTILACVWFAVHRNVPAPQPIQSRHPNFFVRCAR